MAGQRMALQQSSSKRSRPYQSLNALTMFRMFLYFLKSRWFWLRHCTELLVPMKRDICLKTLLVLKYNEFYLRWSLSFRPYLLQIRQAMNLNISAWLQSPSLIPSFCPSMASPSDAELSQHSMGLLLSSFLLNLSFSNIIGLFQTNDYNFREQNHGFQHLASYFDYFIVIFVKLHDRTSSSLSPPFANHHNSFYFLEAHLFINDVFSSSLENSTLGQQVLMLYFPVDGWWIDWLSLKMMKDIIFLDQQERINHKKKMR